MTDEISVGDRVVDTEDDEPALGVVILTPDAEATDWDVDGDTVADHNPSYPDDADVAIVSFVGDLDEWWADWREHDADELFDEVCDRGHKFYAFPAPRLRKVPSPDQTVEALEDAGFPAERRGDDVIVEKFGEYTVRPDGTVEGEGSVVENVEKVVSNLFS